MGKPKFGWTLRPSKRGFCTGKVFGGFVLGVLGVLGVLFWVFCFVLGVLFSVFCFGCFVLGVLSCFGEFEIW